MASILNELTDGLVLREGGAMLALQKHFGHELHNASSEKMTEERARGVLELKILGQQLRWANTIWCQFGASDEQRRSFAASLVDDQPDA